MIRFWEGHVLEVGDRQVDETNHKHVVGGNGDGDGGNGINVAMESDPICTMDRKKKKKLSHSMSNSEGAENKYTKSRYIEINEGNI